MHNNMYWHTVMYIYISVQHQGVGTEGGCAPSLVEREAEDNLKVTMCKTPDLDSFTADKGENFPHVLCI